MHILAYILLSIYFLALFYITAYCLLQFHLLYFYKKHHKRSKPESPKPVEAVKKLPFVTIQLPVFNEMYVMERLIDNIVVTI